MRDDSERSEREKIERLKREWDIVLQDGKIRENNRTGQWKILRLLPVVHSMPGKDGAHLDFVCLRCNAYLLGFRRTTKPEEEVFNLSEVPDYSGGWLMAPARVNGHLTTRPYRCSCAVAGEEGREDGNGNP